MKILYNQNQLTKTLLFGIALLAIGIASLFTFLKIYLVSLIGIGIMYIIIYFAQKNRAYITITNQYIYISRGVFFQKKIEIAKITMVKYFAGDYIITSSEKELTIDSNLIDKKSLPSLKNYFASYIT